MVPARVGVTSEPHVIRTGLPPYPARVRPPSWPLMPRPVPGGQAVNVQPHGRPSIRGPRLGGRGERPAPLRGAGPRPCAAERSVGRVLMSAAPPPWSSAATCAPSTARRPPRDHLRQLQPPPDHPQGRAGRAVGRGQQHRARLHADEFALVKPRGGTVHRAALFRPGRHRPRHPSAAGQHDPPVHHLAQ